MAAAVVAWLALLVGLSVAAWKLGWFVEARNVDRQVNIDNSNKGTQTAWHDEAVNAIADYRSTDPANTAVRGALRTKACGLIARLRPPYRDDIVVAFSERECA